MRRLKVLAFAATLMAGMIVSPAGAWAEGEETVAVEETTAEETTAEETTAEETTAEGTETTESGGESSETTSEEEVVTEEESTSEGSEGAAEEEVVAEETTAGEGSEGAGDGTEYEVTMLETTAEESLVVEEIEIHNLDDPGAPLVGHGEHGTATITLRNAGETTLTGVTATASWVGLEIQQQATFPDIEPGATVVSSQPLLFSMTGEGLDPTCPRSVLTSDQPQGDGDVSEEEEEPGTDEGTEGDGTTDEGTGEDPGTEDPGTEDPGTEDPGPDEGTGDEGEGDPIPEEEQPPLLTVSWEGGALDSNFPGMQVCALFSGPASSGTTGGESDGDENEVTELAATGTAPMTPTMAILGALLLLAGIALRSSVSRQRPPMVRGPLTDQRMV